MNTTTIGLDIAKRLFQAHGMDTRGKSSVTRRLKRAEVLRFFANLQPCLIGMEACASAHHWARKLSELGRHFSTVTSTASFRQSRRFWYRKSPCRTLNR